MTLICICFHRYSDLNIPQHVFLEHRVSLQHKHTFTLLPSVPCPPVDVEPTLDCSTGVARVHWAASRGAHFYSVRARGVEEHECGCETESQSCVLSELMCGFTYNISVTAVNSVCNVSHSAITQMKAGAEDGCRDLAFLRSLQCSDQGILFCYLYDQMENYFCRGNLQLRCY